MHDEFKQEEHNYYKCEFLVDIDPITCQEIVCTYVTAKTQYLEEHQNLHMGYKAYKCDYFGCEEAFTSYRYKWIHK
jgi:hypothetical protein